MSNKEWWLIYGLICFAYALLLGGTYLWYLMKGDKERVKFYLALMWVTPIAPVLLSCALCITGIGAGLYYLLVYLPDSLKKRDQTKVDKSPEESYKLTRVGKLNYVPPAKPSKKGISFSEAFKKEDNDTIQ